MVMATPQSLRARAIGSHDRPYHTRSSWSATVPTIHVFFSATTSFGVAKKVVDGRDKRDHDDRVNQYRRRA
jgi:hypothetical protein